MPLGGVGGVAPPCGEQTSVEVDKGTNGAFRGAQTHAPPHHLVLKNRKLHQYWKDGFILTQVGRSTTGHALTQRDVLVTALVVQNWFKRFQSGNFSVKDKLRSGPPVTDKVDAVLEKVERDRNNSSYDIAEELNIDHKTVLTHLKKARYTKMLDT
ncbi:Histone-lysine N-methyltransferase SETMAR [Eumeta japonica]|uniref:Histone-lysine N-methyltransferase SETMAR n=1 Tax=Eumeta variegata TaxID=151549 RepID=A0A4C2A4V1_EUMVA|nr:Histone-lysine N-methyltransferase SETMAR [Eumeta japonica]